MSSNPNMLFLGAENAKPEARTQPILQVQGSRCGAARAAAAWSRFRGHARAWIFDARLRIAPGTPSFAYKSPVLSRIEGRGVLEVVFRVVTSP